MSNPWKKITQLAESTQNLSEIMSEELAKELQVKEETKFAEIISDDPLMGNVENISDYLRHVEDFKVGEFCDSDNVIANVLQCQYDKEYDDEIKRVEKKRNGHSKVSVSYENYRHVPSNLVYDSDHEEDVDAADKKDLDTYETNDKQFPNFPKQGYIVKDGEIVTKHNSDISGRRNASRVMYFPPEFCTGDGAGFDMKLPDTVFNKLKAHSRSGQSRRTKKDDKKDVHATAELCIDETTKMLLFKLTNMTGELEEINGIISTGKESIVLHANSNSSFPEKDLPRECAIKIFKTTLNEFKVRDKYIEADYRFKDRFTKQNPRKIVHMWAEKEMHNLKRLQSHNINCPDIVCLKKHILVMSFIGRDNKAAPKLKDVILTDGEWISVYDEVEEIMCKMYKDCHMIHADFSEYNILWHDKKCWIIDVSQSVQPDHPKGLEFLVRDCRNITHFFRKKGVLKVKSPEELFKFITGFNEIDINLLEGVHSTFNNLSNRFEIAPDDSRNVIYPFEYCWQRTKPGSSTKLVTKHNESSSEDELADDEFVEMWEHSLKNKVPLDTAANFGNEINCSESTSKAVEDVNE